MSAMKKAMKQKAASEQSQKSTGCSSQAIMVKEQKSSALGTCCATENPPKTKQTKSAKTKIIAHIDCGFTNNLFIRGEGIASLSWDKGIMMKNIAPNEWEWESDRPFSTMQFKVLVNDNWYEQGDNHSVAFGQHVDFTPQF
jgi:hypothetical protein